MNSKPNVPGEIFLGNQDYSWRRDCSVNGWLFVATVISAYSEIMAPSYVATLSLGWRVGFVMAQVVAVALWIRSLVRWIGGMDELHRRITLAAVLFSVSSTFLVVLLWQRLDVAGLFQALRPDHVRAPDLPGIATVAHSFLLMTVFYILGHNIFSRRYR